MNILEIIKFIKEVKGQGVVLKDFKEYLQYKTNQEVTETKMEDLVYTYDTNHLIFTVTYIENEGAKQIDKEPYIIQDIKVRYKFNEI